METSSLRQSTPAMPGKGEIMKSIGWIVKLKGKVIDKVFYDIDCSADYVKRGLVEHDGYNPAITVQRERALTQAEKNSLLK